MHTINIHDAKTHLSRLIEQVVKGESIIIAKAGKPLVKVVPLDAPKKNEVKRIGFMADQIQVPADFDEMGRDEIGQLFGNKS